MAGLIRTSITNPIDPNNPLNSFSGYDPERLTLDPATDTVQGQLNNIISAGSPLMTQARTSAAQNANARGLLNTSMGVQAGEGAVIDKALQVALPDAQMNFNAKQLNQAAGNRGSEFTATAGNTAALNERQGQQAAELQTQKGVQETGLQALRGAQAIEQQQLKGTQDLGMQTLRGEQAANISTIEGEYRGLLQTSAAATTLHATMVRGINEIIQNPNLDEASKQIAVDTHIDMLRAGLAIVGGIEGLDLTSLLTFTAPA